MAQSSPYVEPMGSAGQAPVQPADDEDHSDHLSELVAKFEEAEDLCREGREKSEQCRDYYDNAQLTAAELATLKKRGQAPVIDNMIQRKVDTLCGIERRTRTDPKAFPRNPDDDHAAEAATDSLRYVADQNRFDGVRSEVFNDILVEGSGCAEVPVKQTANGDVNVVCKRVPWDRFWYDPHSRELDFSDAQYKGIVIWSDEAQARLDYPGRDAAIESTLTKQSYSDTYEDRPRFTWCDSKRKRVRVVQCHYKRDGEWWVATYTRGGFLVDPVISPYKDKDGNSACPLIARSGFITRENRRYGHTEGMLSKQDEINKRRSKALHLFSARQSYGNKKAVQDVAAAKRELAKPDGHVEINGGAEFGKDFGILQTGDMAQGQFLLLQQATESMNASGANAALQGKDERVQSGRALQARQQAGATELEPQTDGLREWTHQVYEAMWMRVRQFWTAEKWVRVTDDDRNMKWVGLNKQVTLEDKLKQLQPDEAAQMMQQIQLQPNDPRLQQVIEIENDVSGLDVDIVVDDAPDMATLQGEQFEQLVQLASAPFMDGAISPMVILKASSLRNKDALIDEQEKHQQGQAQAMQAMQQEAHAAGKAEAEVQIQKLLAEIDKLKAQTKQIEVDMTVSGMQAIQGHGHAAAEPHKPPEGGQPMQ